MKEDKNKGVNFDKMEYDALEWYGVTFWATYDPDYFQQYKIKRYIKFEVYSIRRGHTYRLIQVSPLGKGKVHPSGWALQIVDFDPKWKNKTIIISNHSLLKQADFEELFAALAVLVLEEDNPNILDIATSKELVRIRKRWRKMMKDTPEWLASTIESTKKATKKEE